MNLFKKLQPFLIIFSILISVLTFQSAGQDKIVPQHKEKNNLQAKIKIEPSDPWTAKNIITTGEMLKLLSLKKSKNAKIIHIGFSILYNQSHIPGSVYLGPASNPQGIKKLTGAVKNLNKQKEIVLYCGCCPWTDCPNIRPAFKCLNDMGFKDIKILYIPNSLQTDWIKKGYPITK